MLEPHEQLEQGSEPPAPASSSINLIRGTWKKLPIRTAKYRAAVLEDLQTRLTEMKENRDKLQGLVDADKAG